MARELHIIFDGSPGPEGGRFVEVEDAGGHSISPGTWQERADELFWELVIPGDVDHPKEPLRIAGMGKPGSCCALGTYEHAVPMPLNGRVHGIDICVAYIVAALNAGGVETIASCCGHGDRPGEIILADGTALVIMDAKAEDVLGTPS